MDGVLLAIQSLLTTALGSSYTILYGDDFAPAETDFPFVSIEPISTRLVPNGTGGLRSNRYTIAVTLKVLLKDFMQDDTNVTKQSHLQELVKVMEERGANGLPLSTTILGVFNENLSLSSTVHTIEIGDVQYNRQDQGDGSYIRSATITIEAVQQLPLY